MLLHGLNLLQSELGKSQTGFRTEGEGGLGRQEAALADLPAHPLLALKADSNQARPRGGTWFRPAWPLVHFEFGPQFSAPQEEVFGRIWIDVLLGNRSLGLDL